jgi:hypothetical protein
VFLTINSAVGHEAA